MRAVIFDMDGVIIDSEPIHFEVDIKTMRYFGFNISHTELEDYVGMTNPEMWNILKKKYNMVNSIDEIILYQLEEKISMLKAIDIKPIEGIEGLLDQLKKEGIPMGIASSSPRRFIEEVIRKFEIADYFKCIVSGEEVAKGKPAPDVYSEAAKKIGIPAAFCTVIEDSRNGVLAAKAAHMKCIGYQNVNSGNQDLSGADSIIHSFLELNGKKLRLMLEALHR